MISTLNPIGLRTLFFKEVRRFSKVWLQTVLSPLVTTSLYFLVFGVALGARLREVHGVPYIEFVIPGLIMLSMINNAFMNCSSSMFQAKINGTIVDVLVAPLGPLELILAYVGAALVRAFAVGGLVYAVAVLFAGFRLHSPAWTLYFAAVVSVFFAASGLLAAIWAEKFDHLSLFPSFILTPLTFLGGVFYSVDMLGAPWDTITRLNPILYMVSGLRFGLLGLADIPLLESACAVGLLSGAALALTAYVLGKGYKLRT